MKRTWIGVAALASVVGGMLYAVNYLWDQGPPRNNGLSFSISTVAVAIKTDKTSYAPDEPVMVTMTITNNGPTLVEVPTRQISKEALTARLVFRDPGGRRVAYAKPVPTPPPSHTVVDARGRLLPVEPVQELQRGKSVQSTVDAGAAYMLHGAGPWTVRAEIPLRLYTPEALVKVPSLLGGGNAAGDYALVGSPNAVGGLFQSNTVKFQRQ
jgi:hypothetical protein